uniref:Uncharacterized protein n=1 Tax=Caenorhabditis japonica TaxID=281687 RepID=A0A8R1ELQ9_CAEJA
MCFMTFTGEKSGDIFDGFGDGYDGNAGDGGVNDKENERINSRAITFGSVTIWPEMERVIGGGSGEITFGSVTIWPEMERVIGGGSGVFWCFVG